MNFIKEVSRLKGEIDKALDEYLPPAAKEPRIIHKAMRYSIFSGGKRIRPIIVMESAKACDGDVKSALIFASAVEMIHTYSLIHDDLPSMDDDDYRRGKPACHKKFGEANAILAGDALLTLAFNTIAQSPYPKMVAAALEELSDAIGASGMVGGQVMDIGLQGKKKKTGTLRRIDELKTAKLFEASAKLGAITAGADKKEVAAMAEYGLALGMAFQTTDDILDSESYVGNTAKNAAKRYSDLMVDKAKKAVKMFGKRADGLKIIADSISERRK